MELEIIDDLDFENGFIKATLNQADLLAINTNSPVILRSRGVGKAIYIDRGYAQIVNPGSAFAGASTDLIIQYSSGKIHARVASNFLAQTGDLISPILPAVWAGAGEGIGTDEDLVLTCANDLTGGDANALLVVKLWYSVIVVN